MFNFSRFFLEKMDISGKQNVDIFEKWIHFLILWIVLEMKLRYRPGGPSPPDPLRGRVIAFKWPGRPPWKKSWRHHWCGMGASEVSVSSMLQPQWPRRWETSCKRLWYKIATCDLGCNLAILVASQRSKKFNPCISIFWIFHQWCSMKFGLMEKSKV